MKTIFCLVVAMALASQCFGQAMASPTPIATPSPTASPTTTPTGTPTPTASPTPSSTPSPAAAPKQLKKTARMSEIETKFSLKLIATASDSKYHDGKIWLFMSGNPESPFGVMPVMLKPESTDKEIALIVHAVSFCVDYYAPVIHELRERLNKQSPPEVFN